MPCRPVPSASRSGRSPPVVGHLERERPAARPSVTSIARRLRVLRDVLQRLEAAEVHGGLDVLGVAADAVAPDVDRHRRLARLRLERGRGPCRPAAAGRSRGPGRAGPRAPSCVSACESARATRCAFAGSRVDRGLARAAPSPRAPPAAAARRRGCCARAGGGPRPAPRPDASARACSSSIRASSSSVRRTLRSTSPACDARSAISFSSAGVSGSLGRLAAPRARRAARPGAPPGRRDRLPGSRASSRRQRHRRDVDRRRRATPRRRASSRPTVSQTSARSAPIPSPRIRAMRGSTSSSA